jgi:hypothetical protein
MLEKLWNDIKLIYDGLNFSSNLLIDDLMIIPFGTQPRREGQDNCYLLYYKSNSDVSTQIRIEKFYDLVRMWSDIDVDMINYKIYVEKRLPGGFSQVYSSENSMIELSYKVITPFLREVKLNKIGV